MTDDDGLHIAEHKNVIADPGIRLSNDPKAASVVNNTLTHIAEHENNYVMKMKTRPVLLQLLGQAPPPPPPGAVPPPPPGKPGLPQRPPIPGKPPMVGRAPNVQPGRPGAAPGPVKRPLPKQQMPIQGGMRPTVAVPNAAQAPGGQHA